MSFQSEGFVYSLAAYLVDDIKHINLIEMSELDSNKALSEVDLLREIYKKLAGANPAIDTTKALSKASLLRAIASVAKPIPDPVTLPDPVVIPAPVTITSEAPTELAEGHLAYDQVNKKMYLGLSASIELLFTTVDPEPPQG
jgi:hypothetical protein